MLTNAELIKEQITEIQASKKEEENNCNIYVDNKNIIDLANSEEISRCSKHIEVRYHLLRDLVKKKKIKLIYVSSNENAANGLTKLLTRAKLIEFHEALDM